MNLQPVSTQEIPWGTPSPWTLYDQDGRQLFARHQPLPRPRLTPGGLYRDVNDDADIPDASAPEAVIHDTESFPPQGVKPHIWDRVQLRRLRGDTKTLYSARLIGYIKNISILITSPLLDGRRVTMVEDEPLEVRMLTGQNIYVFQTRVQRLCIAPTYYLHLDYPPTVEKQSLRRSPWAGTNLIATVSNDQGMHEPAFVTNLSPLGAQIHLPVPLGAVGERIYLSLPVAVDDLRTELKLEAVIHQVRTAPADLPESDLPGYGVAFQHLRPEDALWLKCLVYKRIAEGHPI